MELAMELMRMLWMIWSYCSLRGWLSLCWLWGVRAMKVTAILVAFIVTLAIIIVIEGQFILFAASFEPPWSMLILASFLLVAWITLGQVHRLYLKRLQRHPRRKANF